LVINDISKTNVVHPTYVQDMVTEIFFYNAWSQQKLGRCGHQIITIGCYIFNLPLNASARDTVKLLYSIRR
jgi:hypothetical protein